VAVGPEHLVFDIELPRPPECCVSLPLYCSYLLKVPLLLPESDSSPVAEAANKHGLFAELLLSLEVCDPHLIVAPHLLNLSLEVFDLCLVSSAHALVLIADHTTALALLVHAHDSDRR